MTLCFLTLCALVGSEKVFNVLTVITQKLPLHVQLHNNTQTVKLKSSELQRSRLFEII